MLKTQGGVLGLTATGTARCLQAVEGLRVLKVARLKPSGQPPREEVEFSGKVQGVPTSSNAGIKLHQRHVTEPHLFNTLHSAPAGILIDDVKVQRL